MQGNIYTDIATRTGGDIYVGVVGPVRTGKSTFIGRFMDTLVSILRSYACKAGISDDFAGFADARDAFKQAELALENCIYCISAYDDTLDQPGGSRKLIGMGRIVGDGAAHKVEVILG